MKTFLAIISAMNAKLTVLTDNKRGAKEAAQDARRHLFSL